MHSLTETLIRSSFINASRKEVADMTLPGFLDTLTDVGWDHLDYLGWRDPKLARRAYVILPLAAGDPVGVVLRQAEAAPRSRALCNWCRDLRLPNDVVFWSAKRAGDAGRRGDTVGTLVCRDFECSRNVRNDPPPAYEGFDVTAAREQRIEDLRAKVTGFAGVLSSGR